MHCECGKVPSSDTTFIDKDKASPQGFMAEYAFSKQFNLHLDIIGNLEKDSFDFISREGATIDVKSTDLIGLAIWLFQS